MTDEELERQIRERHRPDLGSKGYVKVWRDPSAIGAIAFPCKETRVGPFGFMALSSWSVNRAIVGIVDGDEESAIDSLLNWFESSASFHAPGRSVQGRFSGWTIEQIKAHHETLLTEKDSWNNNKLGSEFVFKFMNDHQRERWSKRVLESYGNHAGVTSRFEGEALIVSYRWPGKGV